MSCWYKGQSLINCPYYDHETDARIKCGGSDWVIFKDKTEKTEFRNHHCLFAVPKNCEIYDRHMAAIEAGEEERAKPRQFRNTWKKDYMREYMKKRERR